MKEADGTNETHASGKKKNARRRAGDERRDVRQERKMDGQKNWTLET